MTVTDGRQALSSDPGAARGDEMKTALTIFVLLAILAGAVWVCHYGWELAGDVVMPTWGWLMMGLGNSVAKRLNFPPKAEAPW